MITHLSSNSDYPDSLKPTILSLQIIVTNPKIKPSRMPRLINKINMKRKVSGNNTKRAFLVVIITLGEYKMAEHVSKVG